MITSNSNQKIKQICNLQKSAKDRQKEGVFLVEGIRMFREAPMEWIREVYYTAEIAEKHGDALGRVKGVDGIFVEEVSQELFRKMSDTQSPQGVLAVLHRPSYSLQEIIQKEQALLLVLEDLQDPGNLGTILRTSEGAGVTGVIMTRETVDLFNPKVIRATMGSIYRMPFYVLSKEEDLSQILRELKKEGIATYAAHLEESVDYDLLDFTGKTAFLIGNEGNGLRRETADLADRYLKIPMEGEVESLNAAVATSVLIYEAHRQRSRLSSMGD